MYVYSSRMFIFYIFVSCVSHSTPYHCHWKTFLVVYWLHDDYLSCGCSMTAIGLRVGCYRTAIGRADDDYYWNKKMDHESRIDA